EFVDQVFQIFLAPTLVRRGFALLEHVGFQFFEPDFAFLDLFPDPRIPGAVTLANEVSETPIFANRRGNLQAASEGVHSSNVRVEEVNRLKTLASNFGVEVGAAGRESAILQN